MSPIRTLWSQEGDGEQIVGYVADDEHGEAYFVAEEIDHLMERQIARPAEVAIFYRTNAQSRVFEEVFIRRGLPYKVVGGVRFYERKEIKDALAYVRALINPKDSVSLRRILNVPKRGIGDRAESAIDRLAARRGVSFWEALQQVDESPDLASRSRGAINRFVEFMTELQVLAETGAAADAVLEAALTKSGYLAEIENSTDPQDETRVENLAELVAVAREFVADASIVDEADDDSSVDDSSVVAAGDDQFVDEPTFAPAPLRPSSSASPSSPMQTQFPTTVMASSR